MEAFYCTVSFSSCRAERDNSAYVYAAKHWHLSLVFVKSFFFFFFFPLILRGHCAFICFLKGCLVSNLFLSTHLGFYSVTDFLKVLSRNFTTYFQYMYVV